MKTLYYIMNGQTSPHTTNQQEGNSTMITTATINAKARTFHLEGTLDTPSPSKSGKTDVLLSTHGNVEIKDENGKAYKYGLNLYQPRS